MTYTDPISEALEAKAQALEDERTRRKRVNAAYRAFKKNPEALDFPEWADLTEAERALVENYVPTHSWEPNPWPLSYFTNLRARIRQARKRIETIKARAAKVAEAEAAGGVTIKETGGYAVVTFAEKPSRDILNALRSAGYSWGGGSWVGPLAKLPEGLA